MIMADSPWKEVCEKKLPLVFELLYPRVHGDLDWTQDDDALDQELRKFSPASKSGGRIADRLLKVIVKGSDDPRYFHLEVQGKKERGFRRRIHICNLRLKSASPRISSAWSFSPTKTRSGVRAATFPGSSQCRASPAESPRQPPRPTSGSHGNATSMNGRCGS